MNLEQQNKLLDQFDSWFGSAGPGGSYVDNGITSPRGIIEENRRRYRMLLSAKDQERKRRDLSALPSTKSRSITDSIADNFIAEYFQDPDSISYTAKSTTNPQADELASWLTQIFYYRSSFTFPFYAWHEASIKAGLVDGIEAAYVYWRKESYNKKVTRYVFSDPATGETVEIDEQAYKLAQKTSYADLAQKITTDEEVITRDTWWIDKLIPGDNVKWDAAAPFMDANLGRFVCVKKQSSADEIKAHIKSGLYDQISEDEVDAWKEENDENHDKTRITAVLKDAGELNEICVHIFFFREGFEWKVQFSIEGEKELSSPKNVNDVFFGGRSVNKLPVVIGYNRSNLHEETGAGIPFLLSSHEDEYSNNRNNIQDAAAQKLMRRWRVSKGADVNIDDLLNRPVAYYDSDDATPIPDTADIMPSMRTADQQAADINSLVPVDLTNMGRSVAPKGMNQTLGTVQINQADSSMKRNNMLQLRNKTFMEPILYLIAELTFAFETDEVIAKFAAKKANMQPPQVQGMVDFSALDFPINVSINAGMGSVPRYQKAQNLMQIAQWRMANGVPTDTVGIAGQLNVLAGYDRESFLPSSPPPEPPPKVDYKANITMDIMQLPPVAQEFLLNAMLNGQMGVTAKIADNQMNQMMQNGGMGAPPPVPAVIDATGSEAMGMSQGGMNVPGE